MRKIIPLSTREAWRLYQEGHHVVKMENLRSQMFTVGEGKTEEFFLSLKGKTCWALYLPKEESELIDSTRAKRARRTIGGVLCLTFGGSLLFTYFLGTPARFSPTELLVYGHLLVFSGVLCLTKFFMSQGLEERAWKKIFRKYNTYDYYGSN